MVQIRRNASPWNIIVTATMVLLSLVYFAVFALSDFLNITQSAVTVFSVIGILEFVFILYSHCKITGKIYDLYSVFILLMFMFNFGQCIGWAFGVHLDREIGDALLLNKTRAEPLDVLKAQLVFLECVSLFHLAASFNQTRVVTHRLHSDERDRYRRDGSSLYIAAVIFSVVVIPLSLYSTYVDFNQAITYGYGSLYYGEFANRNPIFTYAEYMFIPCLIALLLGSNYRKRVRLFVYFVFAVYSVLEIAYGDRGSWFYPVLLFLWMHHTYYKRIKKKTAIAFIALSFLSLYVLYAINTVRNSGISADSVSNALASSETNPFFAFLFEMGNSMGVNIIVIKEELSFPLGNSYLLSLLGSVTTSIPRALGIDYLTVSRWFSQEYLGISWGAAFTVVAESVLNFGPYIGPFVFVGLGALFRKPLNASTNVGPIKAFLYIVLSYAIMAAIRNCAHDFLKQVIFSIVPIMVAAMLISLKNRTR